MQTETQITVAQIHQQNQHLSLEQLQTLIDSIPVSRIPEDEITYYIPIHDLTIEDGMKLARWSKMAHEIILDQNLTRLLEISRRGPKAYETYLTDIQDRFQAKEQLIAQEWKEANPMQPKETATAWTNQARLVAREVLAVELSRELL